MVRPRSLHNTKLCQLPQIDLFERIICIYQYSLASLTCYLLHNIYYKWRHCTIFLCGIYHYKHRKDFRLIATTRLISFPLFKFVSRVLYVTS